MIWQKGQGQFPGPGAGQPLRQVLMKARRSSP